MKKLIYSIFLVIIIGFTLVQVYAAGNITIKKSATNLDSNYDTKITLEFEQTSTDQKIVDVVLLIDVSAITDIVNNSGTNTIKMNDNGNTIIEKAYNMISEIKSSDNINANYALVLYGNESETIIPLTSDDNINNKEYITNKIINSNWSLTNRNGSNLQNGVLNAKKILDESTTGSSAENRYLILLTDGAHYSYNNRNGIGSNALYKLGTNSYLTMGNMDSNNDVGSTTRETKSVKYFNETNNDFKKAFEKLYEEKDNVKKYADKGHTFGDLNPSNISPLEANGEIAVYSSTSEINDINIYPYTSNEIGVVQAAKALEDTKANGYKIITIGYLYEWGYNGDETFTLKLIGIPATGFILWTEEVGELYFENAHSISEDKLTTYFDSIKSEIIDNKTTYIIDEMGFGTYDDGSKYDFDFVNEIDKIDISINGIVLDKEKIDENTYGFGKDNSLESGYKFKLFYHKDGLTSVSNNELYELIVNYDIGINNKVKLEYHEVLTDESIKVINGTYGNYDEDGTNNLTGLNVSNRTLINMNGIIVDEVSIPKLSYTVGNSTSSNNPTTGDNITFYITTLVLSISLLLVIRVKYYNKRVC